MGSFSFRRAGKTLILWNKWNLFVTSEWINRKNHIVRDINGKLIEEIL